MLKSIMTLYVSLLAYTSYSQVEAPGDLIAALSRLDSTKGITDPVSTLKDNSKVVLSWKILDKKIPGFFAIERSSTGEHYEVIAVITQLSFQSLYEWMDEAPLKGKSFYRIRYAVRDGKQAYSNATSCITGGEVNCKFYPNPVDNILIIRSEMPVDVQISDASGKIRLAAYHVQGLQTINVSTLEKGIYLLRFNNKISNMMIQEKLFKN